MGFVQRHDKSRCRLGGCPANFKQSGLSGDVCESGRCGDLNQCEVGEAFHSPI
jgi:hypothetical protein